jgi:hypothetical protein
MRLTGVAAALVLGVAASACGSSTTGSQATTSTTARPALSADTICNQAIASDAVVTQATITACNTANVPTEHKCTTGPSVYEAYIPTGNDAILRLGYKPQVYDSASFFVSELQQLCGDSIPAGETPPGTPLTLDKVRALIQAATSASGALSAPTTTAASAAPATASASAACATVIAQDKSVASSSSGGIPADVATALATACSPTEFQAGITQVLPAAESSMAPNLSNGLIAMICPANPHTKLCP